MMTNKSLWPLLSVILVLGGCAAQKPLTDEQRASLQAIECSDKAQCDMIWQRAQLWIGKNSSYRMQTVTDVVIQTYGPFDSKTELAYRAYREPLPGGKAKISFKVLCDNWIGCERPPIDALTELRNFATAGAPQNAPADSQKLKFGVNMAPVPPQLAQAIGLKAGDGVVVISVQAGSSASKAGLQQGDVIKRFGVVSVKSTQDVQAAVAVAQPNQKISVLLQRGKDDLSVDVSF
jgi:hypothetical protein